MSGGSTNRGGTAELGGERPEVEAPDELGHEELRLIDALYATSGQAQDDDDLQQLRRLRGMFAELKDHQEEPPAAGMSLLMAAARQAADARRPVGLWARLRAGWAALAAHPAMSAAAAAMVVVGVAGYLMSRGLGKTAESTYARDELAPVITSAPAASAPAAPAAAAAGAAVDALEEEGATATGAPAGGEPAKSETVAPPVSPSKRPAPTTTERRTENRSRGLTDDSPRPGGAKSAPKKEALNQGAEPGFDVGGAAGRYAAPPPSEIAGERESSIGAAKGDKSGVRSDDAESISPPPPPAATPAPRTGASSGAPEAKDQARAPQKPAPSAKPKSAAPDQDELDLTRASERWYLLAKQSAAKGDCAAVKLLARRVQSEDPGFYERRFRKDPALQKCL